MGVLLTAGDLYFSYVELSDANDEGFMYKCNVFNPFLDQTISGSYSVLHVIPSQSRSLVSMCCLTSVFAFDLG